jgi:hypothetical protein
MEPVAIAPEIGVDALTRDVARERLDRELFSNPYASVVIANIDVYDDFPYLEARYFQVISDPGWNRLLMGETGGGLAAFDGSGTPSGALSEPRGMALDHGNRIYLADSGNHRILILDARSEYDRIELVPVGVIEGLRRPYDVAYSDGGTPDDARDDRLYVADSGQNRVVSYALSESGPRQVAAVGGLGSGQGRFAGPMAIAVGRNDGANTPEVFVADSHNRRIVQLIDTGESLVWRSSMNHSFDVVTSLDTDHWGNLFVTGPNRGVAKYSSGLEPLAEVLTKNTRPRSFHVVFANVNDHTTGSVRRSGQPKGIVIESWAPRSGVGLWNLGVELKGLEVEAGQGVAASFLLTDRARIKAEIADPRTGAIMARSDAGTYDAGTNRITFGAEDFFSNLENDSYVLRIEATSDNDEPTAARAEAVFATTGTGFTTPNRLLLLGNSPNPFNASTQIQFLVPDGPPQPTKVLVFDVQGRLQRTLVNDLVGPGLVSVPWDGRDDGGRVVGSGIYFYRVSVGESDLVAKMILIR